MDERQRSHRRSWYSGPVHSEMDAVTSLCHGDATKWLGKCASPELRNGRWRHTELLRRPACLR